MLSKPAKPQLPAHLRQLDRTFAQFDRALGAGNGDGMAQAANGLIGFLLRERTPAERAEETRYDREVRRWNAWVEQQRTLARGRAHDREVARIRQAACPRCTMTHAGEC
jgi:hypothetical protein